MFRPRATPYWEPYCLTTTMNRLSDRDAEQLESLECKLQLIRDRVQGVAQGYYNGFFLWGEGGTSKSFTIEDTLNRLQVPYKVTNSRVTGKGLYDVLKAHPDTVHLIEDAETMSRDRNAHGVLRSALWGQTGPDGRQKRVVCWQTAHESDEFEFNGGIILVANRNLDDMAELRAVKTRIPCLQYVATNEEVGALMRQIAAKGHRHGPYTLSPQRCLEVVGVITQFGSRLGRNLDLRLLVNTFNDRVQYENGAALTHWRDLLESRMREQVVVPSRGVRAERKNKELEVLRQVAHLPAPERLARWVQETGKSQAALYRRLAELGHDNSHFLSSCGK